MPGRRALSAHGARKLIVKTDGQTKTENDTYAKFVLKVKFREEAVNLSSSNLPPPL
jgi:hypothetical protein